MNNPFAKKRRWWLTKGNKHVADHRPSAISRQLNSQLKIIFPRKSNYQRETNAEFTGFFGTCVPLDDGDLHFFVVICIPYSPCNPFFLEPSLRSLMTRESLCHRGISKRRHPEGQSPEGSSKTETKGDQRYEHTSIHRLVCVLLSFKNERKKL